MIWKNKKPCEWSKTFAMVGSYGEKHPFKGEPVLTSWTPFERCEALENQPSEGSCNTLKLGLLSYHRSFVQPSEGFNDWKIPGGFSNLRGLVSKVSKFKQLKQYLKALAIVPMILLFISCESPTKSDNKYEEFQPGIYKYSGYDESGNKFVSGDLHLEFDDDGLTGNWDMDALLTNYDDHAHIGQGDLVGRIENDTIWCNLHPGWMDHNIVIEGYYENGKIKGEWSYISYFGYTDGGSFKAKYFSAEE